MKYDKERVGRRVKALRTDMGWSQEELAERASTSQDTISSIETGRSGMGLDMAVKLASVLGCSLEVLVCRKPLAA